MSFFTLNSKLNFAVNIFLTSLSAYIYIFFFYISGYDVLEKTPWNNKKKQKLVLPFQSLFNNTFLIAFMLTVTGDEG